MFDFYDNNKAWTEVAENRDYFSKAINAVSTGTSIGYTVSSLGVSKPYAVAAGIGAGLISFANDTYFQNNDNNESNDEPANDNSNNNEEKSSKFFSWINLGDEYMYKHEKRIEDLEKLILKITDKSIINLESHETVVRLRKKYGEKY